MGYPKERKEAVLKKMLPPHNKPIPEIAKEEGISEGTLYNWRNAARAEGRLMPDADSTPAGWSAKDKFAAVAGSVRASQRLGSYAEPASKGEPQSR